MASWLTEPQQIEGEWVCYRQVDPAWTPLYHDAGALYSSQFSGRWHREGEDYAQYLALEPMGAWAELIRFEAIRGDARAERYTRELWLVLVRERKIADLSTFDHYHNCGLDPRVAVGDHADAQDLAAELRAAGFHGLLSPSAALAGATNLTLFGQRIEKKLLVGLDRWPNPMPDLFLPCSLVVKGNPPDTLTSDTTFKNKPHLGYREWLRVNGRPQPRGVP